MPASLQVVLDRELSMVDRITSDTPPLANFQSVHVRYPLLSAAFWKHVLGQPQSLRYLKLSRGYTVPDLASVLSLASYDCTENRNGHADRGPNRIFAPALEELELSGIIFPTERPGRDTDTFTADVQPPCDALSARKEPRGRPIMIRRSELISGGKYFNMDATARCSTS